MSRSDQDWGLVFNRKFHSSLDRKITLIFVKIYNSLKSIYIQEQ